jgi:hypothetical protein
MTNISKIPSPSAKGRGSQLARLLQDFQDKIIIPRSQLT